MLSLSHDVAKGLLTKLFGQTAKNNNKLWKLYREKKLVSTGFTNRKYVLCRAKINQCNIRKIINGWILHWKDFLDMLIQWFISTQTSTTHLASCRMLQLNTPINYIFRSLKINRCFCDEIDKSLTLKLLTIWKCCSRNYNCWRHGHAYVIINSWRDNSLTTTDHFPDNSYARTISFYSCSYLIKTGRNQNMKVV